MEPKWNLFSYGEWHTKEENTVVSKQPRNNNCHEIHSARASRFPSAWTTIELPLTGSGYFRLLP